MHYPYSEGDLLRTPQRYHYTPFMGDAFCPGVARFARSRPPAATHTGTTIVVGNGCGECRRYIGAAADHVPSPACVRGRGFDQQVRLLAAQVAEEIRGQQASVRGLPGSGASPAIAW